jgi:hypothetical protein
MWQCLIGLKKYLSRYGDLNGTKFKEHKPGVIIKENQIKFWIDYLDLFRDWQKYFPDTIAKQIMN